MTETLSGGCQCGRVRYEARVENFDAYWCHCRMCQKATGGIAAAFVEVPAANINWLSEPDWYESSPVAVRPFCSHCGTPLGFRWKDNSGGSDLTVGSFDDPSRFVPIAHAGAEAINEAWLDTRELPRMHTSTTQSVVERWEACGLEVPE
ncbi:GFA family protein [Sphingorhabdus sp.]|uniref:GFA family protein n=1 Tax=Sphingorhabdus sp. TaxID=1902408 RepID=UPI0032B71A78